MGCKWKAVSTAQPVTCPLRVLAAGLHHGDPAHPGDTISANNRVLSSSVVAGHRRAAGQVGLRLSTVVRPSPRPRSSSQPPLLVGAHHRHGTAMEGVIALLAIFA